MTQMNSLLAARFASNTPLMIGSEKADWLGQALPKISTEIGKLDELMLSEDITYLAQDDFWPMSDSWLSFYRPYKVVKGTLSIPVKGMLLHGFGFSIGSYATGYDYIVEAFKRGMADEDVERIAMIVDTPGGEVAGCFDAVDKVFAMRGQKPIRAFVNESAYSAGYAWASVADKITMTRTSGVGSVGVVTAHMDMSAAMEKAGYKITFVFAGANKVDGNPYESLSPKVKARVQKRIDTMYNLFVSTTARNLDVPETIIRSTEALTYGAEEAVDIGFAHEIKPFDEALAAFCGEPAQPVGEEEMPKPNDQAQATFAQADLDQARAEGNSAGVAAEQARISGILASEEAKDRPTMSMHLALKTQQTVDEATALLAVSPVEQLQAAAQASSAPGAEFAAAMSGGNPDLGSGTEADDDSHNDSADTTLTEFRAVTGYGSNQ